MKPANRGDLKRHDLLPAVLTFLLIVGILGSLFVRIEQQTLLENQTRCQYLAANQSSLMRDSIDSALSRTYTIRALLIDNDGDTSFFDRQASSIYEEASAESGMSLKNIAIAPDGIITKVYPLAGNENLLHFDFMDASRAGNQEAIEAYQRGQLVLTQPFTLVQGGLGMAGRLPVFLSHGDEAVFWGLVTVTLDFEQLLESFRLDTLSDMGLNYELWYTDESGSRISLASTEQLPADPVNCTFTLSKTITWNLSVAPASGWVNYAVIVLALLIILAIALLTAALLLDRLRLDRANTTLEQLANLDSLTLCFSRHYVNIVLLNQRTGRWNDPNTRYSLAILDIDCFKQINDTYGHEIGDRAIVAVAQILLSSIKQANGDCVIRFGGDEFILLFNDVTLDRFISKLADIVRQVAAIRFDDLPDIRLTASIGGEPYIDTEHSQYYEMVEQADKKLYYAKTHGRNQYCIELSE